MLRNNRSDRDIHSTHWGLETAGYQVNGRAALEAVSEWYRRQCKSNDPLRRWSGAPCLRGPAVATTIAWVPFSSRRSVAVGIQRPHRSRSDYSIQEVQGYYYLLPSPGSSAVGDRNAGEDDSSSSQGRTSFIRLGHEGYLSAYGRLERFRMTSTPRRPPRNATL